VLEVVLERGIGVVDKVEVEGGGFAVEGDGLVYGAILEARRLGEVGGGAAEEAEFGVGIVAAALDPAIEEEVAAFEEVGVDGRIGGEEDLKLGLELRGEFFVSVEREDPVSGSLLDGKVFLGGESGPIAVKDFGAEGTGDLRGAVGGIGIDDDDFVGELDAGKCAREVAFFVQRDDGDGEEGHRFRSRAGLPVSRVSRLVERGKLKARLVCCHNGWEQL